MTSLLVRLFVKDRGNVKDPAVRASYGYLGGFTGIAVNILLSVAKILTGIISGSISVTADGVNNLSDAGSSVVSLVGIRLASRPADKEHPFGHARIEYITTIAVAFIILSLGIELAKSSVARIITPEQSSFDWLTAVVLFVSILVKIWLAAFNRRLGRLIDSDVMKATATDSIMDVISTSAVLAASLISAFSGLELDGYMGCAVAALICVSGVKLALENVKMLLGQAPDPELIETIYTHIKGYEGVRGVHDLIVHNYGPNMWFASVHVEVSSSADVMESHDMIDNIERDMWTEHGVRLVIHMDPIEDDNQTLADTKKIVAEAVSSIDGRLSIHDFRMVPGPTHTNLVFDVLQPYDVDGYTPEQLSEEISLRIGKIDRKYNAVITVDREFVPNVSD